MSTSAHSHVRLTLYPPMSGLSFGFVNNVTAPHTGKRRKMKLSQKAGRISVPYLPANRSEWDELLPSIHTWGHHREVNEINNWTSKFNLNLHMDLQSPTLLCQRTGCALRILIFCFSGCVVRGGACRRGTGGRRWASPVTIPAMNTLMLAQREPAQNKPRVRYAFLP